MQVAHQLRRRRPLPDVAVHTQVKGFGHPLGLDVEAVDRDVRDVGLLQQLTHALGFRAGPAEGVEERDVDGGGARQAVDGEVDHHHGRFEGPQHRGEPRHHDLEVVDKGDTQG